MNWIGPLYFYVCAATSLVGALVTISARNPIRGAMGLMMAILAIAGMFLALNAEFLAAIQLIVYAGAIVVLFLFVIMLLGPTALRSPKSRGPGVGARLLGGAVFAIAALVALVLVVRDAQIARMPVPPEDFGGIDSIGRAMFTEALAPFELSSALLMVAVVGAVAVAKGGGAAGPSRRPALAKDPRREGES